MIKMITENFYFLGADGKTEIHAMSWTPNDKKNIKGVIQISHGLTEYIGRYALFAEYFTSHGYVVCGLDFVGHGESTYAKSGNATIQIDKWQHLVRDMDYLHKKMSEQFPDVKYIMLGFSMGSFLLRAYQYMYPGLDNLILVGTGLLPESGLKIAKTITKTFCHQKNSPSKLVKMLAFDSYNFKLKDRADAKKEAAWLLVNNRDEYLSDPYVHQQMTPHFFEEFIQCVLYAEHIESAHRFQFDGHILFLSGENDPLSDLQHKRVDYVKANYEAAGALCELDSIKHFRHDILHDTCYPEAYTRIIKFITQL